MKADCILTSIFRHLRPKLAGHFLRSPHLRSLSHSAAFSNPRLRAPQYQYNLRQLQVRHESSTVPQAPIPTSEPPPERPPSYEFTSTCKPCGHRSTHTISKQGYHKGTVLVTCPSCKNRHLIADHLKIFSDKSVTIEDLMREKGQLVKRGHLGGQGDVEFWDDGTQTERANAG